MKDFLTLEEFILLPDDPDQKHTWSQPFSGDEWVARYKIAKNSFITIRKVWCFLIIGGGLLRY